MSNELAPVGMNNTVVKEGGGNAAPLPDGTKLLVSILQTKKEGAPVILKRPYSKDAPNNTVTALAIRFAADAANERGAGRNFFVDVPWARNLKSTGGGKHPDGTPAYLYFQLFRALGYNVDPEATAENPTRTFAYPGDHALLGEQVEIVLGIEAANGEYEARNSVKFINKATGVPNNSALFAKADANPAAATGGAPQAAPAAAPGWTPGGAAPAVAPAGWSPAADVAPAAQQAVAAGAAKGF